MSKNQIVIVSIVIVVVGVFVLILAGVLPGLQKNQSGVLNQRTALNMWVLDDTQITYGAAFSALRGKYKNASVAVRTFTDSNQYELELLDAMAAGAPPDIFEVPSSGLIRFENKIRPLTPIEFPLIRLRALFPATVEESFFYNGAVYALPLSIDTPALLYNKEIFNRNSVTRPPATWNDLETILPAFVKRDAAGNLMEAGIALGGPDGSVAFGSRILELLLIQADIIKSGTALPPVFSGRMDAVDALAYYTKFSDPESGAYAWNAAMPYSTDAFLQERVAMIFGYARTLRDLKERNRLLNVMVAPMLQRKDVRAPAVAPAYRGLTVSNQSRHADLAWELVRLITTDQALAEDYAVKTNLPPALNLLIEKYANDPNLGVFARQALVAKSWPKIDDRAVDAIFSDAIQAITRDRDARPLAVLSEAQQRYDALLRRWGK